MGSRSRPRRSFFGCGGGVSMSRSRVCRIRRCGPRRGSAAWASWNKERRRLSLHASAFTEEPPAEQRPNQHTRQVQSMDSQSNRSVCRGAIGTSAHRDLKALRGTMMNDECLPRQARIIELARHVWHENDDDVAAFLSTPHAMLGGRTPLECCATERDTAMVEGVLLRLAFGVDG